MHLSKYKLLTCDVCITTARIIGCTPFRRDVTLVSTISNNTQPSSISTYHMRKCCRKRYHRICRNCKWYIQYARTDKLYLTYTKYTVHVLEVTGKRILFFKVAFQHPCTVTMYVSWRLWVWALQVYLHYIGKVYVTEVKYCVITYTFPWLVTGAWHTLSHINKNRNIVLLPYSVW